MINRELIRLKTLQLVYAFYRSGGKEEDIAQKELDYSLAKAYELYEYMLATLVEVRVFAEETVQAAAAKAERLGLQELPPPENLLAKNRLLLQLEANEKLAAFRAKRIVWTEEPVFVGRLLKKMLESEAFKAYQSLDASAREWSADKDLVKNLYKECVCDNDDFNDLIEDHSLYWNDDKDVVDSFVLKTIRRFRPDMPADWPLLPEFDSENDREFAKDLFSKTLELSEQTRTLIEKNCRNWEFSRLAFMDVVIMQQALAEILSFPSIPVNVTFNEYLNLAKVYSTPRSAPYINGLLDHIVKKLRAEGKLMK